MKSFKQMIQAGEVKRADAMKVLLDDIHEEPGFNLRQEGQELNESIQALANHIQDGGIYPALEVRPREDGGVFVVDGHRRRRALILARQWGAPIEWVNVVAFTGNDLDRTARVLTSAEGRGLSPLETALGYKRLAAFGKTADEIAKLVGKSRQHVDQGLILANAPAAIHQAVASKSVSAALAVDLTRKHGDDAGKALDGHMDQAKAQGKAKVTAGTVKGKALPAKVVAAYIEAADGLLQSLTAREHEVLSSIRSGATALDTVMVSGAVLLSLLDAQTAAIDARADQKRRAADKAARAAQKDLA